MLNRIISFSIRNKLIVMMMTVALIGWGVYNTSKLPIDAVPDITNNQVLIITVSPSLGAADIERLITFPIEQSTRNISGIIEQRSFSRFGLSLVTIVFNDATDIYWARQQVSERLTYLQKDIPPGLGTPQLGPVTTGLGEIFQYIVKPKPGYEHKYDAMELRSIQDWVVRRQLLGTAGVADVSSFGGKLKQYEIAVNTDKLRSYNINISDVFSALEKNNQNTGGAYIEKGPAVLFIRSEGLVQNKDDIGNIIIKSLPDGTPLLIRQVAEIKLGMATRYGAMTYNDEGEVAGAVVMMLKGENSSKVIKAVKEKIAQIEKTLPEGVTIEPFLDRTKMVNNAIGTVEKNLLEGALIVIFILVIFLGNLRAGLLVASVIPLSMLFAISMMNLFGVSGNLMSLGALDFGLIVDGAVIIVEAVMHRLHHNKHYHDLPKIDQQLMDEEVNHSASKMMNAAVFGQIIILIVYLPILSLEGIEGKMFKPMAQTVAFAIVGAFLLSITYIPMMSALVLSKKISNKKNLADKMMAVFENIYRVSLQKAIQFPKTIISTAVVLFIISVFILSRMGGEFIPKLEEGDFAVDTRVLTGSSLSTTINTTQQAARLLKQGFPEVEKVVTKIGSGEIPTDPMPIEASDMMVILKPKEQWTSAKTFDELAEKMSKKLEDIPGITAGFQFPVQMRFNELMTGGRQDVVCKIFGEDLDTLSAYAEKLGEIIRKVDGAKDLYIETQTGLPQIVVNYDRTALSQYGLSVEEVNKNIAAAFAGAVSGQVFENERRFDLVVRSEHNSRQDISDVQNLLITTPKGEQVPLQQVASVELKVGPNQIQRENAQRRISIGFNVRGKDVETVVKELQSKVKDIKFPPAYYITYGGQFENLVAAKNRLSIAVPISLLLIFIMLYFAFNSMKQGMLIYSAIPLSAIGGILALWLRGMPFSISAGVGFIALFGVAVLNGIVLIAEFNQLKEAGVRDIKERVMKGTRIRLRPVLMTAAVASLGFLPMAISNGAGAEVQRPLATVVIGGLITATFLTLMLLPVLYMRFEHQPEKKGPGLKQLIMRRNKKGKRIIKMIMLPLLLVIFSSTQAQLKTISLKDAIDSALRNNLLLAAGKQHVMAGKKMEASAWDIPFTNASAEYGKINSTYIDTRYSISQSLSLPAVYNRQKDLLRSMTSSGQISQQLTEMEIKKQVTLIYYSMLYLQHKKALLTRTDSLYTAFLKKQEERFKAGDANILERTAAATQQQQAANQLKMLDADIQMLQERFSYYLHSSVRYEPFTQPLQLPEMMTDTVSADLPLLRWKASQTDIAFKEWKLSRSKLLPNIILGYSNQSFTGIQNINGADVYYNSSQRFSSVNAGLSFPLFFGAGKAKAQAVKLKYEALQTEYREAAWSQQKQIRELQLRLGKQKEHLQYYEQTAMKQAKILSDNATLQFSNGAISYLEWIMLSNQAISIQAEYLDAQAEWNRTIIEIKSITNDL